MADRHAPDTIPTRRERRGEMTEEQSLYLHTLCDEIGVPYREDLTRGEAIELIDELQIQTGRARD
ncbi:MAG: DUF3072 domain-containing protein [Fimbriimonas sp.]